MPTVYRVKSWLETFEPEKRLRKRLSWFAYPNDSGSTGLGMLLNAWDSGGREALAVWPLILSIVADLPLELRDGRVMRGDGEPHTVRSMAARWRLPVDVVQGAIDTLSGDAGWVLVESEPNQGDAPIGGNPRRSAPISPSRARADRTGQDREGQDRTTPHTPPPGAPGSPDGDPGATPQANPTEPEPLHDRGEALEAKLSSAPRPEEQPRGDERGGMPAETIGKRSGKARRSLASEGTRLPADFALSPALREFAVGLGVNPDRVLDEFRDYWNGIPGARGKKLDWPGTYRNRCRDVARRAGLIRVTAPRAATASQKHLEPTNGTALAAFVKLFNPGFQSSNPLREAWCAAGARFGGERPLLEWCREHASEVSEACSSRSLADVKAWLGGLRAE